MHTYKRSRDGDNMLWTVGYYTLQGDEHFSSDSTWQALKDFPNEHAAAAYVNYLNGGTGDVR